MANVDFVSKTDSGPVNSQVKNWLEELEGARKRLKEWHKEGKRVIEIYEGVKKDQIPFNILYSNTETLNPALYNSLPRPEVRRRFKDEDPLGKHAATAGQRVSEFLLDTNSEEYSPFDDVMGDVVLDALLPGQGSARVKYDAKINEVPPPEGSPEGTEPTKEVEWETICYDSLKWDRWLFGYAKKWKRVPWISIQHDVTYKEAEKLFGVEKAKKMKYAADDKADEKDSHEPTGSDEDERKTATVYEIWDKAGGRKVRFIAPTYKEGYLKVDADPLQLTGFYPIPEPLKFLRKSNNLMPVPLYSLYENQAKELNRITTRINKVVEAIKVRGAYDSTLGEIEDLLNKPDNTLVPADNVAALQDGGLEKAIWLMPIEKLVVVFQQLMIARQNCKQVIYEITGISDILRGASVASETATAQEIKNQWGTLRLKKMQRDVQRYARDLIRITIEIAATKFSEDTFAKMTGLPFVTPDVAAQAEQVIQAAKMQAAVDPAIAQSPIVQQAQQALAAPQWSKVLELLRSDTQRMYRIDIETNSTVDLEATEDQKNITEVMGAIAQFLQGVTPLVQSGSLPFQAAQALLLAIIRRYRFGTEIEDYIKEMQAPKNPDEGKQKELQAKMQMDQQVAQLDLKVKQAEMLLKEKEAQMNAAQMEREAQFKEREHQMKMDQLAAKSEYDKLMARVRMTELEAKMLAAEQAARLAREAPAPTKSKEKA